MKFEEIDLGDFHQDTYSKYFYIEAPYHELSTPCGRIYLHRYLMAQKVGRKLLRTEHVHHKDSDRSNNKIENLELLTSSEHSSLHMFEKYGESRGSEEVNCVCCGAPVTRKTSELKKNSDKGHNNYCSPACQHKFNRKFEVDKDTLQELVWTNPTKDVAELFGVCDNSVAKRCKLFGIEKPPRGYWQKVNKVGLGVTRVTTPDCVCSMCAVVFKPTRNQYIKAKRQQRDKLFCSRICTGKYGKTVQQENDKARVVQ